MPLQREATSLVPAPVSRQRGCHQSSSLSQNSDRNSRSGSSILESAAADGVARGDTGFELRCEWYQLIEIEKEEGNGKLRRIKSVP